MAKKNELVVGHMSFGPSRPVLDKITAIPIKFSASTGSSLPIVSCLIAECPNNKGHRCTHLSVINIGLDGKCGFGVDAKKHFRAIRKMTGDHLGTS